MSAIDFSAWYEVTYPRVMAAVGLQVGDLQQARDATDEGFARALERWHHVAAFDRPELWTYRVAVNVARRTGRRRRREGDLWHQLALAPPAAPAVPDPAVWDAVRRLPDRQRQAIALRYLLDLRQAEIAQVMHVAPGTVAATLHQARRALEAALADDEQEHATGGAP